MKLIHILQQLNEYYGEATWQARRDGLSELVLTILSQHTTDRNSLQAFRVLWDSCKSWEYIHQLSHAELVRTIQSAGLAQRKATYIRNVLDCVAACRPAYSLDFLHTLTPNDAMHWLTRIPGVGAKTAACVLLFAYGMPLTPVDTHIQRVSHRLGLVTTTAAVQSQQLLESLVPHTHKYAFHVHMIRLGREICHARTPECLRCPLHADCATYTRRS